MYHLDTLVKWQRNELFPPLFIEFGPVSGCNHHCIHCYVKAYTQRVECIKEDLYLRFMKEIGEYGVKAIVLAGCGEPLLHKATPRAIQVAKTHGVDVGMFSNGILINDGNIPQLMSNLTYIRLTINGCSARSYSKVHQGPPGDWQKINANLKKLVAYKKRFHSRCTIGVYTILLNENIGELEGWVRKLKRMGVDYIIIKPPEKGLDKVSFVDLVKVKKFEPVLKRIARMGTPHFLVQVRWDLFRHGCQKEYARCLGLPFMCAVDADGSVYACNWFWKKNAFSYGNLTTHSFKEIWEGRRKAAIVRRVSSAKFDLRACGLCRQNSINTYLWELANPPEHVNFI